MFISIILIFLNTFVYSANFIMLLVKLLSKSLLHIKNKATVFFIFRFMDFFSCLTSEEGKK